MSSLRLQLQKSKTVRGRRWTIKRDENDKIINVRLIYDTADYQKAKNAKPMYGDKALLKILTKEFNKTKE
jgi:hypothetical protein